MHSARQALYSLTLPLPLHRSVSLRPYDVCVIALKKITLTNWCDGYLRVEACVLCSMWLCLAWLRTNEWDVVHRIRTSITRHVDPYSVCVQCCWIKKINELKLFVYIPTTYSRVQYRCYHLILALDLPLTLNENEINLNIAWFIRIEKLASSSSNATKPSCPMDLCFEWKNKMQMRAFSVMFVSYLNDSLPIQRWYWHSECVHYGLCGLLQCLQRTMDEHSSIRFDNVSLWRITFHHTPPPAKVNIQ